MLETISRPVIGSLVLTLCLAACSYNPLSSNNHLTGSPVAAVAGAGIATGTAAALGVASKPELVLAGAGGAGVGYYLSTQRFASAGVVQAGGQVYQQGDYVTIELPSDQLFEANTADLLPSAEPALKSTANILKRYPDHNIMVSGNTSGFGLGRWEQRLSELRARQVAGYLWGQGVTSLKYQSMNERKLTYVGYGNYFPIANQITSEGVRQNSRIQITAYPTRAQLGLTSKAQAFNNIGSIEQPEAAPANMKMETSEILPEGPASQSKENC